MIVIAEKQKARAIFEASEYAEECLLGAILVCSTDDHDRQAISKVAEVLTPECFLDKRRARIYKAMLSGNEPPHQVNVGLELAQQGVIESQDIAYMSRCISIVPMSLDYLDYAQAILELHQARTGARHSPIKTFKVR